MEVQKDNRTIKDLERTVSELGYNIENKDRIIKCQETVVEFYREMIVSRDAEIKRLKEALKNQPF